MFETSAEVLGGLLKAFSDYAKKNEAAWRKAYLDARDTHGSAIAEGLILPSLSG
jgi:hypothetical protein